MNQKKITNYGSALGEAIGAMLEREIHRVLEPLAQKYGCNYIKAGPINKQGRNTKLILKDAHGNGYNLDAVIINNRFQPLVLIESKYIRYKKHNRDKASWICTAHPRLRETYPTIRKSIAILMGNWSSPSKKLLKSFQVEYFEISFQDICDILQTHDINFNWQEKDRETAKTSWEQFSALSNDEKDHLAKELIRSIKPELENSILHALNDDDNNTSQQLVGIKIVINTEKGETHIFEFDSLEKAVTFMENFNKDRDLDTTDTPSLIELASKSS